MDVVCVLIAFFLFVRPEISVILFMTAATYQIVKGHQKR